jgi:predicted MFS family arabinose efflux permease
LTPAATQPESVSLWVLLLPRSATRDARRLLVARTLRGFADGCVSVLLASYLTGIGYTPLQVGAIVTGTLLGSAALTLATGLLSNHLSRRRVLLAASLLMVLTGLGFAGVTAFWPLFVIAVVGTLNPSSGDVSVFLPTEQALLPDTVAGRDRTSIFARYQLGASLAGAFGALISGVPVLIAHRLTWDLTQADRLGFVLYTVIAITVGFIYSGLSPQLETKQPGGRNAPLARSRGIVLRLAATFSLDAWGGGFAVQSLLALWLFERFALSPQAAGAFFFGAGLLAAFSQLLAPRIAARIGLINTMAFTHLPSNVFLILAAFMPNAPLAVAMLLLRQSMSQMDIAARQTYTMSVVPPEERPAAASVTNVPRSLAAAAAPLMAGALLSRTSFGWPLVCGGSIRIVYDLLLLLQFRAIKPPAEDEPAEASSKARA